MKNGLLWWKAICSISLSIMSHFLLTLVEVTWRLSQNSCSVLKCIIHIPGQEWRKVCPTWWQPANCRLKLRSGMREAIWWGEISLLLTLGGGRFARIWGRRRRPPADNSSRHCRRPTQTLTSSRFLAKLFPDLSHNRDLDLDEAGPWRKWVLAKKVTPLSIIEDNFVSLRTLGRVWQEILDAVLKSALLDHEYMNWFSCRWNTDGRINICRHHGQLSENREDRW